MEKLNFARLVSLHPSVCQHEFELTQPLSKLGRLADVCDLCINQPTISRIHAQIEREGSHYIITNLSRNNTFINGSPLDRPHILKDQDAIGLSSPEPLLRFVDLDSTVLVSRRLQFLPATSQFSLDSHVLELTPTQLKLLSFLFGNRGQLCSREMCEEVVWGKSAIIESSALHRLVADIRSQFRKIDKEIDPIETLRGLGYVLKWF